MQKKSYHHKDLKNTLIEKGIELVSTEGIEQFSLRRVAAACGVSHAAPYSHFKNKEELFIAMQQHITEQFADLLQQTIALHTGTPDLLLYLGKTYIDFFLEHVHYFSFLYVQSDIKIDLSVDCCDLDNFKPYVLFRDTVFSLPHIAALSLQEKRDYALALWAFVHGIASIATMQHVIYEEAWEDKIIDLLRTFQIGHGEPVC